MHKLLRVSNYIHLRLGVCLLYLVVAAFLPIMEKHILSKFPHLQCTVASVYEPAENMSVTVWQKRGFLLRYYPDVPSLSIFHE